MTWINKRVMLICTFVLVLPSQTALGCCGGGMNLLYFISQIPSAIIEDLKPENRRKRREHRERTKAKQREEENLRRKAQMNVPDMEVKEIIITLDEYGKEKWEIRLEDPINPGNHTALTRYFWPEQRKNRSLFPEETLKQGDRIVFGATERNYGWYIYNDRGEKITSIRVENVQLADFSEKNEMSE